MMARNCIITNWGCLKVSNLNIKCQFNLKNAAAFIKATSNEALTITGEQALEDTNMHVPKDQDHLEASGRAESSKKAENGKYDLIWATPYAQYLYHGDVMYGNPTSRTYGPKKISFTSALAKEEWAKYAAEVYGADWQKVYAEAMRRKLK